MGFHTMSSRMTTGATRRPLPGQRPILPAEMSVKQALEWAFGTECASFDYDEIGATAGSIRQGRGTEVVLAERHALGASIDMSGGRSDPAEDAEVIASVVRGTLPWHAACTVADLARAGRTPDWMLDATPRLVPLEWVWGRGGKRGRTGDSSRLGVTDDGDPLEPVGWPHQRRHNRKGAIVEDVVIFTPCTWTPSASQIGSARRAYLDWYGWLLEVQWALRSIELRRFAVNDKMPPLRPWAGDR